MADCPVLVVDDDEAIRDLVTQILETEGYAVATATNGAEALDVIEDIRRTHPTCPALILLDMRMPVLDGWGVARTLKERGLRLPIVVMTAARDARVWAAEIGADSYLAKPFELDDLLLTVSQVGNHSCG
ncbi:MAG TPA: response regulator [Dehalococcoidia bacterium]|nr:response regulator [Dehalococcoidia bacterium]